MNNEFFLLLVRIRRKQMDVLTLANRLSTNIFGSKSDDDFSDRLNYRYTVAILILFSIILNARQYGSSEVTSKIIIMCIK